MLFTDYRFPGDINGIEPADNLRMAAPATKVVIASGFDSQTIQSQAGQGDKVISKPYSLESLQDPAQHLFPNLWPHVETFAVFGVEKR